MSRDCFLNKSSDFTRALRNRRGVLRHNGWRLYRAPRPPGANPPAARFAAVIARRHVKSAARRNAMRRVLREYFRQHLRAVAAPMDYLMLLTQKKAPPVNRQALRDDCRFLIMDIGQKTLPAGDSAAADVAGAAAKKAKKAKTPAAADAS